MSKKLLSLPYGRTPRIDTRWKALRQLETAQGASVRVSISSRLMSLARGSPAIPEYPIVTLTGALVQVS